MMKVTFAVLALVAGKFSTKEIFLFIIDFHKDEVNSSQFVGRLEVLIEPLRESLILFLPRHVDS